MGLFVHLGFGTTTSSLNVGRQTVFVRLVPIIVEKHTFIPVLGRLSQNRPTVTET